MRKVLLGTLVGFAFAGAAHADDWVVEARFSDQAALQRASRHFTHVIVDKERGVLRVDTDDAGITALQAEGLEVTIDAVASAKLAAFYTKAKDASRRGLGLDGIPGFECFRTLDETFQTLDDLEANHPDIAKVDLIGPSWQRSQNPDEGYDVHAMHITNFATLDADPDRPAMAALFSIHAREYTPLEIGTRFAEWLVENYGTDPEATWLVDHNDFHLILPANPDARPDAEEQIYQRKNLNIVDGPCPDQDISSQPGIDLNRNFPFHWNITLGWGSSDFTCDQTFHGPAADGSNPDDHIQGAPEPETAAMVQYIAGTCAADGTCSGGIFADHRSGTINPDCVGPQLCDDGDAAPDDTPGFFLDMHSNAALVLWPWGDTEEDSLNATELRTLGRRIAWFTDYRPQQSNELYFTDGTTVDSMYGLLGVASYTIENDGFDFFEDCGSFESVTAPTNLESLRYIARTLHAPYRLPLGPDTVAVTAPASVDAGASLEISAQLDSSRFGNGNGTQPVHDIASAAAYVDALPWDAGAIAIALTSDDGTFDSSSETAFGSIPTAGLTPGRHFVYVQATDVDGNAGTPNAAYFEITGIDDRIFADSFEASGR
ncbi:MAG: M14 family zinc carboxypeptidase [Rhodanobacteraceae bacterium]